MMSSEIFHRSISSQFRRVAYSASLMVAASMVLLVEGSHTLVVAVSANHLYQCGNPLSPGTQVNATDGFAVQEAAVDEWECPLCICDVNNSGAVTVSDAQLVQYAAVGTIPLSQLQCRSEPSICTPCNATDIKNRLQNMTGPALAGYGPGPSGFNEPTWIIFDCPNGTPIDINATNWATTGPTIDNNGAKIFGRIKDGAAQVDRQLTLQLFPKCYSSYSSINDCTETGTRLMLISGDNNNVETLTFRGFHDGVHFSGENNTVGGDAANQKVTFDRMCDDAISNEIGGVGNEVRNTVIKSGCDKCVQGVGDNSDLVGCSGRDCYHVGFHNVDFDGCTKPIKTAAEVSYLIRGGKMRKSSGAFDCQGPVFEGDGVVVDMEQVEVKNCKDGLWFLGTNSEYHLDSNLIRNGQIRGVIASEEANVTAKCNKIVNNGGSSATTQVYGGVGLGAPAGVDNLATVTLGGDSSTGRNHIKDNKAAGSVNRELHNTRATTLQAPDNWWGTWGSGNVNASGQPTDVSGSVNTSSPRSSDPIGVSPCQNVPPPS